MTNILSYKNWLTIHSESVYQLYIYLLNQNNKLFNINNCSFDIFSNFCYINSSKDKTKYL